MLHFKAPKRACHPDCWSLYLWICQLIIFALITVQLKPKKSSSHSQLSLRTELYSQQTHKLSCRNWFHELRKPPNNTHLRKSTNETFLRWSGNKTRVKVKVPGGHFFVSSYLQKRKPFRLIHKFNNLRAESPRAKKRHVYKTKSTTAFRAEIQICVFTQREDEFQLRSEKHEPASRLGGWTIICRRLNWGCMEEIIHLLNHQSSLLWGENSIMQQNKSPEINMIIIFNCIIIEVIYHSVFVAFWW